MGLHGQDLVPGKPALPGCPHLPGLAVGPASLRREPAGRCRGVCPCGRPLHWRAPAHVSTSAFFCAWRFGLSCSAGTCACMLLHLSETFAPKLSFLSQGASWCGGQGLIVAVSQYRGILALCCRKASTFPGDACHGLAIQSGWPQRRRSLCLYAACWLPPAMPSLQDLVSTWILLSSSPPCLLRKRFWLSSCASVCMAVLASAMMGPCDPAIISYQHVCCHSRGMA